MNCNCCVVPMSKVEFSIEYKGDYRMNKCPKCGLVRYETLRGNKLHPGYLRNYLSRCKEITGKL